MIKALRDIKEKAEKRRDAKGVWCLVTNELVCSFADPDDVRCKGKGVIVDQRSKAPVVIVCPCAPPRFEEKYYGKLRRKDGKVYALIGGEARDTENKGSSRGTDDSPGEVSGASDTSPGLLGGGRDVVLQNHETEEKLDG